MMKKLILTLGILLGLWLPAAAVTAHAQSAKDAACAGIGATEGVTGCDAPGTPSIDHTIAVVVNILSLIVGLVAVVMIIVAGLKFITASGDSNNITSARNTIIYAIVGLIVVAMAQVIVHFVLNRVSATPQCSVGQVSTAAVPCR